MKHILIVAGSSVVRAGLEVLVTASPDLAVVGSTSGVAALAQQVEELQPDVVLLDLEPRADDAMPPALLNLGTDPPACTMVVLTDDVHAPWISEALRAGVRAVLPRDATAEEIVAGIEATAAGLVVLHPDALEALTPARTTSARAEPLAPSQALTAREIEVLVMMAEGLGNKTIAWRLGISEHTVKFHIASIFTKLKVSSRTEAVTLGIRQGLIML